MLQSITPHLPEIMQEHFENYKMLKSVKDQLEKSPNIDRGVLFNNLLTKIAERFDATKKVIQDVAGPELIEELNSEAV